MKQTRDAAPQCDAAGRYRLEEGIWLEGEGLLLPWGTPAEELLYRGAPKVAVVNGSTQLTWAERDWLGLSACILWTEFRPLPDDDATNHGGRLHAMNFRVSLVRRETVEAYYERLLELLTARLGPARECRICPEYPGVAWDFGAVQVAHYIFDLRGAVPFSTITWGGGGSA